MTLLSRKNVRIATRESPLALCQSNLIKAQLEQLYPELTIEIVGFTTQGDQLLETSLLEVGGKGLFVKELEAALLDNRADLAVHSLKDMTVDIPNGLTLSAFCKRVDVRDAFVSNQYKLLSELPSGAKIGTSSLRRQCQLKAMYPQLEILTLRGNVNTRLRKLDEGEFDGIILAAAGLQRLGLAARIQQYIEPEQMLPAAGQGILAIESREDDNELNSVIQSLMHKASYFAAIAERSMNQALGGGCHVPIAAYAEVIGSQLRLRGLVGKPDGDVILQDMVLGPKEQAEQLGKILARNLIARGAQAILREL